MNKHKWRLPVGVDEILAPEARQLELLRRRVLDVFDAWGFEYIEPPIIEFIDALLVGGDEELDLQTLKVVDQVSGRLMGVRSDMTAQAVRIDALRADRRSDRGPSRLCYAGTVVHAVPFGVHGSRVPLKAGAEIFGVAERSADAEVVALMLEVLHCAGVTTPVIVLGHMGIYRSLIADIAPDLSKDTLDAVFGAVQRKSETDLLELLPPSAIRDLLVALPGCMGDAGVLQEARTALASHPKATAALQELAALAEAVDGRCRNLHIHFDLSELAGFGYHNGPLFSAYHPQIGRALARGGRYDGIGAAFSETPRAATGFDVNLRPLLETAEVPRTGAIWVGQAPAAPELYEEIQRLRAAGERVIVALAAQEEPPPDCDRELSAQSNGWRVRPLEQPLQS